MLTAHNKNFRCNVHNLAQQVQIMDCERGGYLNV